MRKLVGMICVILGVTCLLAAIGFVLYNRWEADNAARTAQSLLEDVRVVADEEKSKDFSQGAALTDDHPEAANISAEMETVEVDGYDCIGVLSVPVLGLELPVLTDWSYSKLKIAPCHYYGSYYETDFVIAAHNYKSHFGRLQELQAGDLVIFTDVNGAARYYEVVLLETLPPTATEQMITSGFDLSLYTCTLGGSNRVTVRCNTKSAAK